MQQRHASPFLYSWVARKTNAGQVARRVDCVAFVAASRPYRGIFTNSTSSTHTVPGPVMTTLSAT